MGNGIRPSQDDLGHVGHDHLWDRALSRRQFLGTSVGAAGAMATSPLWTPSFALAGDRMATVAPRPIGIGVAPFGIPIHHFPPVPVLGPTAINEPSQITDFNGFVGITRVRGTGTGTDTTTGATQSLNFQVDNGFMDGVYVGEDGKVHRGTFAFVWMDIYKGTVGVLANQIHDFSPGIPASGLFWTQPIPKDNVRVHFGDGAASVKVHNLAEEDAGNVHNALQGGPTTPGSVSFDMRWTATAEPMHITDPVHHFTGKYFIGDLTIQWSAKREGFTFESDPADTSLNLRSVLGRERNGVFFDDSDEDDD